MRSGAAFKIAFQPVSWVKGVRILKRATASFNPRVMVGRPKATDSYSP